MLAHLLGQRIGFGALLVRLALGAVFVANGYAKMFTMGLDRTVEVFQGMGVAAPELFGPLVAFLEFFGGIALVLGLFTRYVGLLLAVILVVAIFTVKVHVGFIAQNACGYELDLALLGAALLLLFVGPGVLSLETALFKREL